MRFSPSFPSDPGSYNKYMELLVRGVRSIPPFPQTLTVQWDLSLSGMGEASSPSQSVRVTEVPHPIGDFPSLGPAGVAVPEA